METGKYDLLSHLAMMTGLTDRTLRRYIASGILKGEKISGLWHFSREETDKLMNHPAVKAEIRAKCRGEIDEFLGKKKASQSEMCVILDVPQAEKRAFWTYFHHQLGERLPEDVRFFPDASAPQARVVLMGKPEILMDFLRECPYCCQRPEE